MSKRNVKLLAVLLNNQKKEKEYTNYLDKIKKLQPQNTNQIRIMEKQLQIIKRQNSSLLSLTYTK